MEFACTTCKSDNIQRLAVVYEGGLSNIRTQSTGVGVGVGMGRGGLGSALMSTSTRGTAQTEASKRAAPPRKKPILRPLLALFFVFLFPWMVGIHGFWMTLAVLIWIVGSVTWYALASKYNTQVWPPLKASWDRSFLCNRCNAVFELH